LIVLEIGGVEKDSYVIEILMEWDRLAKTRDIHNRYTSVSERLL